MSILSLDQFKQEAFIGYVENVKPERQYLLGAFLPNKPVYDLKFSYNVINKVYTRTASITGFNADAPLRDKDNLSRAFGEVAKVQHGFRIEEEELLRFKNPRNSSERDQAIQYVYDQTDNLVTGVRDIEEWMRAQAIYNGVLTYNENDVQLSVDFGIQAGQKLTPSTPWSTYATATPIQDLLNAINTFKSFNNNKRPVVMHMTSTVEADLLQAGQVKAQIYGTSTDPRIVTKDQLRQLFNALSIPPYQINDDVIDNGSGATGILPTRRVVLLGEDLGNTMIGPTIEKNFEPGIYVLPIVNNKPPSEEVYVGETVFPALQRPQGIVHINV